MNANELLIWLTAGVLLGIPVGLFFLFALTRPPRETVRTEYVYRVNGEVVNAPMSDADEEQLAISIAKAKALYGEKEV